MEYRLLTKFEKLFLSRLLTISGYGSDKKYIDQVDKLQISKVSDFSYSLSNQPSTHDFDEIAYSLEINCHFNDLDNEIVYVDLLVDVNDNLVEIELWKPVSEKIYINFAEAELKVNQWFD